MSPSNSILQPLSRRSFLGGCAAAGAAALLSGCRTGFSGAKSQGCQYKPIPDWPTVPDDIEFVNVTGVATDSKGRVYITGGKVDPVVVFDSDGKYVTSWGGDVINAKHGLRIRNDKVWITDIGSHQVFEFTLGGKLLRSFGAADKPGDGPGEFNKPTDVAFAPDGTIYISDGYVNTRVVCLNPDGSFKFAWGAKGSAPGEFDLPHGIAIDAKGRVYVADRGNSRVQIFTPKGEFITQWTNVGRPFGLDITPDQTVFAADGEGNRVFIIDPDGKMLSSFGETGEAPGQFRMAHSIHVDVEGNLYVTEVTNKRVQKFVPIPG